MGKSGPNPTFILFFLGLGWPWVGEFVGFIVLQNLVDRKHPIGQVVRYPLFVERVTSWMNFNTWYTAVFLFCWLFLGLFFTSGALLQLRQYIFSWLAFPFVLRTISFRDLRSHARKQASGFVQANGFVDFLHISSSPFRTDLSLPDLTAITSF